MDHVMKRLGLRHPLWLILASAAPQGLLCVLSVRQYEVVRSLLEERARTWAVWLFLCLVGLAAAAGVYGAVRWFLRRPVQYAPVFGLTAAAVPLMYVAVWGLASLSWVSIPQWMMSVPELILLAASLMLPSVVYGLIMAAHRLSQGARGAKAWLSFLGALVIPTAFYVLVRVVFPVMKWGPSTEIQTHSIAILFVLGGMVFFFLIIRGSYLLLLRKGRIQSRLVLRIVLGLALPMTALVVYNFGLQAMSLRAAQDVFGHFESGWYYALATLTGVLVCVPSFGNPRMRLAFFLARLSVLPFTLYFGVVFLPYAPIAIPLIIFIGLGILILAPFGLVIVHVGRLREDVRFIRHVLRPLAPRLLCAAALLVIPVAVCVTYLSQRAVLRQALAYTFSPDLQGGGASPVRAVSLIPILDREESLKKGGGTPILTPLYRWIVLGNGVLSDQRLAELRSLYTPGRQADVTAGFRVPEVLGARGGIRLKSLRASSVFDDAAGAWVSSVELEIANDDTPSNEYAASFSLPEGAGINGYHLFIGDRREEGMPVERRAAMWVYRQIKTVGRDPGLVFYNPDGSVSLKVFPFGPRQVRRAGFRIVHPEPFVLRLDGQERQLGMIAPDRARSVAETARPVSATGAGEVFYVPEAAKRGMPAAARKPYLHFILDCSEEAAPWFSRYKSAVSAFINGASIPPARVSFVDSSVRTVELKTGWTMEGVIPQGGFFLDRALRSALVRNYVSGENTFPVFVVVSPRLSDAFMKDDLAELSFTFPETDMYWHLDLQEKAHVHSLLSLSRECEASRRDPGALRPVAVFRGPGHKDVYLAQEGASVVFPVTRKAPLTLPEGGPWETGVVLRALWMRSLLYPADAEQTRARILRAGMSAGILTPVTALICVENEAQKRVLQEKQRQAIAGGKDIDLGEETIEMAEPGIVLSALTAAAIAGLAAFVRRAIRRRR